MFKFYAPIFKHQCSLTVYSMPRKARNGQQASEEKVQAIKAGVAAVEQGMSIRGAAKQFGIPYTTKLYNIRGVARIFRKRGQTIKKSDSRA